MIRKAISCDFLGKGTASLYMKLISEKLMKNLCLLWYGGLLCLFLNQNILKPNRELEKLFNFCKNMGNFPIRYLPGIKLSYTDESV